MIICLLPQSAIMHNGFNALCKKKTTKIFSYLNIFYSAVIQITLIFKVSIASILLYESTCTK